MLIWFIVACEIGFWVLLLAGLLARYIFRLETLGKLMLMGVPLLDLALLVATASDLHRGTPAEFAHGLAAVYLGFTLVYGPGLIKWADQTMANRLSGEKPPVDEKYGWYYAAYEWKQWLKGATACAIAAALLALAIFYVDRPDHTAELQQWFAHMLWFLGIWLAGWPLWYTVFPKKQNG